jgi:hypothetical protein
MKSVLLLLLPLQLFAQDLTGVWKGELQTKDDSLLYELVISESNQKLTGYALTVFNSDGVEKIGVKKVLIKSKNGKTSIEDGDLIYNNYPAPNMIKLFANLSLQVEDTLMFLTGTFITRSLQSAPNVGTIHLKKQNKIDDSKLLALLDKSNLINTLSFIPPKANDDVAVIPAVISATSMKVEEPDKKRAAPINKDVDDGIQTSENDLVIIPYSSQEKKTAVIIDKENKQVKTTTPSTVKKSSSAIPYGDEATNAASSQKKDTGSSSVVKNKPIINSTIPPVKDQPSVNTPKKDDVVINSTASQKQKLPVVVEQKQQESKRNPEPAKVKDESVVVIQKKESVINIQKNEVKTSETATKQAERKTEPPANLAPGKKVETVISSDKNTSKPLPAIVTNTVAELSKRRTEVIESVSFKSDSLVLTLYDNGVVDGDTVSVVLNGNVLMARQGLTANAITTTVYITPDMGDLLQLVMFAENLGSIPPNTGLLVIQDGNDRYNIRFAGDLQKSSAIILRRKR